MSESTELEESFCSRVKLFSRRVSMVFLTLIGPKFYADYASFNFFCTNLHKIAVDPREWAFFRVKIIKNWEKLGKGLWKCIHSTSSWLIQGRKNGFYNAQGRWSGPGKRIFQKFENLIFGLMRLQPGHFTQCAVVKIRIKSKVKSLNLAKIFLNPDI